jgi:hypothetical protein
MRCISGNGVGCTASSIGGPKALSGPSTRSPSATSPHQQAMAATAGTPSGVVTKAQ